MSCLRLIALNLSEPDGEAAETTTMATRAHAATSRALALNSAIMRNLLPMVIVTEQKARRRNQRCCGGGFGGVGLLARRAAGGDHRTVGAAAASAKVVGCRRAHELRPHLAAQASAQLRKVTGWGASAR